MSAVHHLDAMGNVKWPRIDRNTLLVFIFITHAHKHTYGRPAARTHARVYRSHLHTHISSCSLWLMRPRAGDGSIKELPPLSLSLTHTLSLSLSPLSNTHLIDSSDLTEKREMGNWKMVEEDWKQRADYKLCEETKGLPSAFSLSTAVAGVCLTGAWLRRTKDITTANKWTCLVSPDAVNVLGW